MVERNRFLTSMPVDPELDRLLKESACRPVTEDELREQRISFAYGNALGSENITKESVRQASERIMMRG